jgi:hypothetical protein
MMKQCRKCGQIKDTLEFHADKTKKDGFNSWCKLCRGSKKKFIKPAGMKKCNICGKIKSVDDFHKNITCKDGFHGCCKDCKKQRDKERKEKRKETIKKQEAVYYKTRKQLRKINVNYRLRHRLSNRLAKIFNYKDIYKVNEIIGCTVAELKNHLESQFLPGMTWKNYGFYGWHIDHIRPCSSYNLSDINQVKKCFHFSNLRPLWWQDNLSKGSQFFG